MPLKALFKSANPPQWSNLLEREPWVAHGLHKKPAFEGCNSVSLQAMFVELRKRFIYEADFPGKDVWGLRPEDCKDGLIRGDCDDFAVEILRSLQQFNIPAMSRSLVMCKTEQGEPHMVSAVHQDGTTYIMDNRLSYVAQHDHRMFRGYEWLGMSRGKDWYFIKG